MQFFLLSLHFTVKVDGDKKEAARLFVPEKMWVVGGEVLASEKVVSVDELQKVGCDDVVVSESCENSNPPRNDGYVWCGESPAPSNETRAWLETSEGIADMRAFCEMMAYHEMIQRLGTLDPYADVDSASDSDR